MNCFYKTLFVAVTAVLAPLYAMAIPGYDITIRVDDPQRVKVEFCQYSEVKQTVDFGGATSVTMEWPYNLSMRISATDGNILTAVKAPARTSTCSACCSRRCSLTVLNLATRP